MDTMPDSIALLEGELSPGDKPVHAHRKISIGAGISILSHLVLVLVLGVFFSDNFLSGTFNSLPSFAVSLSADADSDTAGLTTSQDVSPETAGQPVSMIEATTSVPAPAPLPDPGTDVRPLVPTPLEPALSTPDSPQIAQDGASAPDVPGSVSTMDPGGNPGYEIVATTSAQARFTLVKSPAPGIEAAETATPEPMPAAQVAMIEDQLRDWNRKSVEEVVDREQITWRHDGAAYTAYLSSTGPASDTDFDRVQVRVSTEIGGKTYETSMQLRRLAFSDFGQFVDHWDDRVTIFNDEIEGRFHSNSMIHIDPGSDASPVFHGRVTMPRMDDLFRWSERSDIFQGGLETRVAKIPFPQDIGLAENDMDADSMHVVDGNVDIEFLDSGAYSVRSPGSQTPVQTRQIPDTPYYIIGSEDSVISVRGIVNGRVVVYSPEMISIAGDLHYAEDPETLPGSDDYLGLISGRYVEIAAPEITGPGDLTVQAAIYAIRRFTVERYSKPGEDTLTIYGSLAAGSVSASEPRFATRIRYDERFAGARPPGYPLTDQYEVEAWDRQWREVE